jgi:hypothetical protein
VITILAGREQCYVKNMFPNLKLLRLQEYELEHEKIKINLNMALHR